MDHRKILNRTVGGRSPEDLVFGSRIHDIRYTPEEQEEMVERFSFIFDWILFSLSSIGIIIAACTTLADALNNRDNQLKVLNSHS